MEIGTEYKCITGMFLESCAGYLFISFKVDKNCKNSEQLCQLLI